VLFKIIREKKNENSLKLFGNQLSYTVHTWIVFDLLKFFFSINVNKKLFKKLKNVIRKLLL